MKFGLAKLSLVLILCTHPLLLAQEKATPAVPFVGCAADGQVGPQEAPKGTSISVSMSLKAASQLAYYSAGQELGVLAPRGWYCFGTYGSGGDMLFVSPQPIDTANLFSADRRGFSGVVISHTFGDTSGRFEVAEVIARVFPAYESFVNSVTEPFDLPGRFPSGPYPKDILTYKGKTVVEFTTPPQTEGFGTQIWLRKNASPISGAAILVGPTPDLLFLSVRVPADRSELTSAIVGQVESDAARLLH